MPTEIKTIVGCSAALDIERESYYRLEKTPWKIKLGDVDILAAVIGIRPGQFRFPPPTGGVQARVSLDDLLEDVPDEIREVAVNSVRGIVRK